MHRYVVVLEKTSTGYSAYAPDVTGVGMVGKTIEETLANMEEALEIRFQGILERGGALPEVSATDTGYVEIDEAKLTANRKCSELG